MGVVVPAAMFQTINPAVIIIFGSVIAFCLKLLARANIKLTAIMQVMFGVALLTIGFLLIALDAKNAELVGKAPMLWVVVERLLAAQRFLLIQLYYQLLIKLRRKNH
jgi:dipeptide/tripeptide permease